MSTGIIPTRQLPLVTSLLDRHGHMAGIHMSGDCSARHQSAGHLVVHVVADMATNGTSTATIPPNLYSHKQMASIHMSTATLLMPKA